MPLPGIARHLKMIQEWTLLVYVAHSGLRDPRDEVREALRRESRGSFRRCQLRLRGFHCGTPLSKATIAQRVLSAIAASYVHRAKTQEATGRPRRRRRRLFCHRRGTPNAVAATKESIDEYVFTRNDDRIVRQICLSHRYVAAGLGPGPQIGHGVPADVGPEVDDRRQ